MEVGILHSLTGTLAISEKSVVDSTLLAIEDINKAEDVLGKKLNLLLLRGNLIGVNLQKMLRN